MLNLTTEALLPSRQCFGQVYLHCKICFDRNLVLQDRLLVTEGSILFLFFVCLFFLLLLFSMSPFRWSHAKGAFYWQILQTAQTQVLARSLRYCSTWCLGNSGCNVARSGIFNLSRKAWGLCKLHQKFAQCKSTFIQTERQHNFICCLNWFYASLPFSTLFDKALDGRFQNKTTKYRDGKGKVTVVPPFF